MEFFNNLRAYRVSVFGADILDERRPGWYKEINLVPTRRFVGLQLRADSTLRRLLDGDESFADRLG